jgi:branched-chain amino acid transport system substrate-binding protein
MGADVPIFLFIFAPHLFLLIMSVHIGVLLPRSVEYPSMAFDLLDGIRLNFKRLGLTDYQLHTENTGFGENPEVNYAAAEKLVMQHDVELIIAYATSLNAEALYSFAETTNKPILFIDAGMEIFEAPPHRLCRHITLQGLMACKLLGDKASRNGEKAIIASSFFDGGYRSSWVFNESIAKNGGSVVGHYVSQHLPEEFQLQTLEQQIQQSEAKVVTAAFSTYFVELFMKKLQLTGEATRTTPFYCSPFMADEQLLHTIPFPGATLHTIAPWSTSLDNAENKIFMETVKKEKNKTANIFHLLGWEAAIAAQKIITENIAALDDWSFESPRGAVHFHPETHTAYAPLYEGKIAGNAEGKCWLNVERPIAVEAEQHRALHFSKPDGAYSRWKNNFFCI